MNVLVHAHCLYMILHRDKNVSLKIEVRWRCWMWNKKRNDEWTCR